MAKISNGQLREGYINSINLGQVQCKNLLGGKNQSTIIYGNSPLYLAKLDSSFNMIWGNEYGTRPGSYTIPGNVIQTYDNGFLMSGYDVVSTSPYDDDIQVFKTDSVGNIEWAFQYGGPNSDRLTTSLQKKDSSYILAGTTQSITGYSGPIIIKLDKNGSLLWSKFFSSSAPTAESSVLCSDSGYAIINSGTNNTDVMRFNADDSLIWNTVLPVDPFFMTGLESIIETEDHGLVIAGSFWSNSGIDGLILKLNYSGVLQWYTIIDFGPSDGFRSVVETNDSGFLAVGSTDFTGWNFYPACFAKVDKVGNLLWGHIDEDSCCYNSIYKTPDGFVIGGDRHSIVNGLHYLNTYIGEFDSLGYSCSPLINSGSAEKGYIGYYTINPIIVPANLMLSNNGSQTPIILQYVENCNSFTAGIEKQIDDEIIMTNPVNDKVMFSNLAESKELLIQIENLLGVLVKGIRVSDVNEIQIDVSGMPSEMYIVKIINGSKIISKRLIKI